MSEDNRPSLAWQQLHNIRHFASLPADVQQDIAAQAVLRRFNANQVIFLEGEPAEALYILAKGWVKSVRLSQQGREQAIMVHQPGDVFGDVAVFTGAPYPGTTIALEDVHAWTIDREAILALIARHPELALALIRHLGERILHFVELVEDLSLRSVEARLARTLLQHAEVQDGQLVVPRRAWTTLDEMAARLGTVRDVLGRTLRGLEERQTLQITRKAIVILDPKKLSELGEI